MVIACPKFYTMTLLFRKNKEKKEKFAHILTGVIILVHAYEKFDEGRDSFIYFLTAGIIFLSIAIFHHRLVRRFHFIDGVFFVIESCLYAVIAAEYFNAGKKGLPWCYVATAIIYLFVAFKKGKIGIVKYKG